MVVIIGAGIVGAATAYYLTTDHRGASSFITVFDAVGPASGSSGKAGAFVTNRPPLKRGIYTNKRQPLFEASYDLHQQLARDLKLQSFCPVQNYQTMKKVDQKKTSGACERRREHQESTDCKIPSWLPGLRAQYDCESLSGDSALVDPAELTSSLLNVALSEGNCCCKQGTVSGLELDSSGRSVSEIHFDFDPKSGRPHTHPVEQDEPVVIALGAWSCRLEDWIGVPTPIEGVISTSLLYHDSIPTTDIGTAFFFDDDFNGCHLEVFGRQDRSLYVSGCGESQVIGTESLRSAERPSPQKCPPDLTRAAAAASSLQSIGFCRVEADAIKACMRPMSPDGVPIVGKVFGNVYIATGGGPWGITWGPLMGRTLASLIADDGNPPIRLGPLKPDRFDTLLYRQLLKSRAPTTDGI